MSPSIGRLAFLGAALFLTGCLASQPVELSFVEVEAEIAPEVLQLAAERDEGLLVQVAVAGDPRTVALVCHRGDGELSVKRGDEGPEPHAGGPLVIEDGGADEGCLDEIPVGASVHLVPSVVGCAPELDELELHEIEPGALLAEVEGVASRESEEPEIVCWADTWPLPFSATVGVPIGEEPGEIIIGTPPADRPAPVELVVTMDDVDEP